MSLTSKNTQNSISQRSKATSAAIASVRAEGLTPSLSTTRRLELYVDGKISAKQLHEETLRDVKDRVKLALAK